MKRKVIWADPVRDLLLELPEFVRKAILQKTRALDRFPRMYEVRRRGRFRRHRRFQAAGWNVYYRVVNSTVYIRGIWPARIP